MTEARLRPQDVPVLQDLLARREVVVAEGSDLPQLATPGDWQIGSLLLVPLVRGGWVAGLLAAGYLHGGPKTFSRRQMRLAQGLGHHGSIALQNARLVANLETADKLKSEFVSTMSHELRTPLNVITGYTEMLREGAVGPLNPAQLELVDRLDTRGRELLELIEATLHAGRLEADCDTVEIAPVEFDELVRVLQASTSGLPRSPSVNLDWIVTSPARPLILTDRSRVALVVRNLVSNALKFTSSGRVTVRLTPRDRTLVIEVEDTGIGISSDNLPIIFEMFRQVDGSMTRRHGGVGLGLYIVRQFVRRLGGMIEVASTPGRGTTFTVTLPGVAADERDAASRAA
jgi:signal transduction histidine kinase